MAVHQRSLDVRAYEIGGELELVPYPLLKQSNNAPLWPIFPMFLEWAIDLSGKLVHFVFPMWTMWCSSRDQFFEISSYAWAYVHIIYDKAKEIFPWEYHLVCIYCFPTLPLPKTMPFLKEHLNFKITINANVRTIYCKYYLLRLKVILL